MAWPSAWAISRFFRHAGLSYLGPGERMRWLEPLGFSPCPPGQRRALEGMYGSERWPRELQGSTCLWFVVDRAPDVPPSPSLAFLKAVSGRQPARHARENYAGALAGLGVSAAAGWLEGFRRLFAGSRQPGSSLLLFPGAGHPLKQWPLVQYFQLADLASARGLDPVFVLGPAELERGLKPGGFRSIHPQSLAELEECILGARFVVGGDTGPMHLAGMLGVPGVSLFGPTSFAQWGPVGMEEASLGLPCSPCTATCADLSCPAPRCLEGIDARMVLEKLEILDGERKTGFQGPGIP